MGAYLRENEVKHVLNEVVMHRRHYLTSMVIFVLCQTCKSLEPDIRKLLSSIFLCKVSKKDVRDIMGEIIEGHTNDIDEIIKLVFLKPCNYFLSTSTVNVYSVILIN